MITNTNIQNSYINDIFPNGNSFLDFNNFINFNNAQNEFITNNNHYFFGNIEIIKQTKEILIKRQEYKASLNLLFFSEIIKIQFNTLDEAYDYIIKIFKDEEYKILNTFENESIELELNIYNQNIQNKKKVIICLNYNDDNNIDSNKDINIKSEILDVKNIVKEIYKLIKNDLFIQYLVNNQYNKNFKYEISNINNFEIKNSPKEELKENDEENIISFEPKLNLQVENNSEIDLKEESLSVSIEDENNEMDSVNNLIFSKELAKDSYAYDELDNTFALINKNNNQFYMAYATNNNSIITYDLNYENQIFELPNAHKNSITNLRHYSDKINNKDLVLSISDLDNSLKIWDFDNWKCLVHIENENKEVSLDSAVIFEDNKENLIITSYNIDKDEEPDNIPEPIKVYDFKAHKVKEIKDSNFKTYFIDTYYDKKLNKNFIITGNKEYIKSYDYTENKVYHIYDDKENKKKINGHTSVIIYNYEEIVKLIDSSWDGNIRIWNFHTNDLLNKFQIGINDQNLYGICLWNNNYLYVGCDNYLILVNLKTGKIENKLEIYEKDKNVLTIKKLNYPKYGKCLIIQGLEESPIKLYFDKEINLFNK